MTATLSNTPKLNHSHDRLPEASALSDEPAPWFFQPIESACRFYLRLSQQWREQGDTFEALAGEPNQLSDLCHRLAQDYLFRAWEAAA